MPANTAPIFPVTPNIGAMNVLLTAAMTNTKAFDGTEATGAGKKELVFTAGANGARVDTLEVKFTSTNGATASGTTAATVVRFWANNGSADTTAANNQLLGEIAVAAQTVTALATATTPVYTLTLNKSLPAGYKIYAGITVAVGGTNCALQVSATGGDY
jgi:hypothetical protein